MPVLLETACSSTIHGSLVMRARQEVGQDRLEALEIPAVVDPEPADDGLSIGDLDGRKGSLRPSDVAGEDFHGRKLHRFIGVKKNPGSGWGRPGGERRRLRFWFPRR